MSGRFGWDRLSHRDRRALVAGLVLVVPALIWVVGVRPYRNALTNVQDQVAAERALLERERELVASAPTLRHGLEKARERADEAERRLVSAANTALAETELIDYLETVAQLSRVLMEEVRSVAPGRDEVAPEGLQPVRLAVRGESDLEGVLTFLETLETNPLLLRIAGLTIEPVMERPRGGDDDDDGPPPPARPTGVVEMAVVVEAYARPADAPDAVGSDGELPVAAGVGAGGTRPEPAAGQEGETQAAESTEWR